MLTADNNEYRIGDVYLMCCNKAQFSFLAAVLAADDNILIFFRTIILKKKMTLMTCPILKISVSYFGLQYGLCHVMSLRFTR